MIKNGSMKFFLKKVKEVIRLLDSKLYFNFVAYVEPFFNNFKAPFFIIIKFLSLPTDEEKISLKFSKSFFLHFILVERNEN